MVYATPIKLTNQENWPVWKASIVNYLTSKGLSKHLADKNELTLRPKTRTAEEKNNEKMEKAKVMVTIQNNMTISILSLISNYKEPNEVWGYLVNKFESKSYAQGELYYSDLDSIRYSDYDDMSQLISKFMSIKLLLEDMGEKISQRTLITKFMRSLDKEEYEDFKRSIRQRENRGEETLNFEKICEIALREEIEIKLESNEKKIDEKALNTRQKKRK